jgi:hypothetical protein
VHAASDSIHEAAAGAGIQGRGRAPGRGGSDDAPFDNAAANGCPGQIRGLSAEPGPIAAAGISRAQALLDARDVGIRVSLNDHAERVEKRRRLAAPLEAKVTAADRMEALRERLANRMARRAYDDADRDRNGEGKGRGRDVEGAGSQCVDVNLRGDKASEAQASGRAPHSSKEDVKMHLGENEEVDTSSSRAASTATASDAAASFAAWHGRGLHLSDGAKR